MRRLHVLGLADFVGEIFLKIADVLSLLNFAADVFLIDSVSAVRDYVPDFRTSVGPPLFHRKYTFESCVLVFTYMCMF